MKTEEKNLKTIVLGGGCFWCTEAIFQRVKGIESVESGYAGGTLKNPTYEQVCSGKSGHAEVIKIKFNNEIISLQDILQIFWKTHDPTTLNRQGNDVGTQYRSVIFYTTREQKEVAEKIKNDLDKENIFNSRIVTEITPLINYYRAEDYHQNYFNNNKNQPYCNFVIIPKIEKFNKLFNNYKTQKK